MHGHIWLVVIQSIVFVFPLCKSDAVLAPKKYCGLQHTDDYIGDNDKIALDEFPWVAQILYDENKAVKCVGSLINRRYVLTAAHCIRALYTNISGVRFGDYDVSTDIDCTIHKDFGQECNDPLQEFDIEELIIHPNFYFDLNFNDIGLIRLSKNVVYTEYIRPICLPDSDIPDLKDEEELAVSGWGYTNFEGNQTKVKKKILVALMPWSKCYNHYKNMHPITDNNLCVLTKQEALTCKGDSGGPLMLSKRNQWYQIGIVSFGGRCDVNTPTVYIKVVNYLKWTKDNLRA